MKSKLIKLYKENVEEFEKLIQTVYNADDLIPLIHAYDETSRFYIVNETIVSAETIINEMEEVVEQGKFIEETLNRN